VFKGWMLCCAMFKCTLVCRRAGLALRGTCFDTALVTRCFQLWNKTRTLGLQLDKQKAAQPAALHPSVLMIQTKVITDGHDDLVSDLIRSCHCQARPGQQLQVQFTVVSHSARSMPILW
jgi:hypothetical protein